MTGARLNWWGVLVVMLAALTGCLETPGPQAALEPTATATTVPTPTLPPTPVPGSTADERDAANTARQFGAAVTRGDHVVALLVLSPSAQQVVAAGDASALLGTPEPPEAFEVRSVQLTGDVATAECRVRYRDTERTVRLRLVRLDGVWKIDARVGE